MLIRLRKQPTCDSKEQTPILREKRVCFTNFYTNPPPNQYWKHHSLEDLLQEKTSATLKWSYVKVFHEYDAILVFDMHWERNICGGFHNSWKRSPSWLAAFPISRSRLTLRFVSGLSREDLQKMYSSRWWVFWVDDNAWQKLVPQLHKWGFLQGGKICADTSLLLALLMTVSHVIAVLFGQIQFRSFSCNDLRLLGFGWCYQTQTCYFFNFSVFHFKRILNHLLSNPIPM